MGINHVSPAFEGSGSGRGLEGTLVFSTELPYYISSQRDLMYLNAPFYNDLEEDGLRKRLL